MTFAANHLLSALLFTPLLGAVALMLIPGGSQKSLRLVANLFAALSFLASLALWARFPAGSDSYEFRESADWIPSLGAHFSLGVDGISLLLVLLTTLLGMIAIFSAGNAVLEHGKEFYVLLLLLQTCMLGALLSLDFFLFYIFWEAMLVPAYFLIAAQGGEARLHAAMKFLLYNLAGSLSLLLAILGVYFNCARDLPEGASATFDIPTLLAAAQHFPDPLKVWLFSAILFAFA